MITDAPSHGHSPVESPSARSVSVLLATPAHPPPIPPLVVSTREEAAPSLTFESVYDELFPFIWRAMEGLGVRAEAMDDVTQEVFLVVHRKLATFERRSSLKTWVYGIAVHVARRHRRSAARRREDLDALDDVADVPSGERTPHEALEDVQAATLLHEILDRLPDEKREAFVLAEIEELTAPEIAEVTGTNVNTVYARIRAARAAFEQALARLHARERGMRA